MLNSTKLSMSISRIITKAQKGIVLLPLGCALMFAAPTQQLVRTEMIQAQGPDIPV